ncbi:MAG: hypothetical protein KJO07_20705 [Deltaproteobacteria bacterium]|nr:hypothetical protein [Deltaproteobacteria bacterium]
MRLSLALVAVLASSTVSAQTKSTTKVEAPPRRTTLDSDYAPVIEPPKEPPFLSRLTVGFGLGAGSLSAGGGEPFSTATALSVGVGYRIDPRVDVGLRMDMASLARYQADPSLFQTQDAYTLGLRYSRFGKRRGGVAIGSFSARLGAGLGTRYQNEYSSLISTARGREYGFALVGGVAWVPVRTTFMRFGFELANATVLYGDQTRNGTMLLFSTEFN